MNAPVTSLEFDKSYRASFTFWGDVRIPKEIKKLSHQLLQGNVLDLGCGIGRFTQFMANHNHFATGVDFSSVAIEKATKRASKYSKRATFHVKDVTDLGFPENTFDASFDVGCFHCLDSDKQLLYVSSLAAVLKNGATHLIWAMNKGPSDLIYSPELISNLFSEKFTLAKAQKSWRRFAPSYWYWLRKRS